MAYESIPSSPGPSLPAGEPEPRETTNVVADQPTLMSDDAASEAYAKDLQMNRSAVVAASVLGDIDMVNSAVAVADVSGRATLRDSAVGMMVADSPVELLGGTTGVVVAKEFTVRDGGTVLMTGADAVKAGAVFAGVFLVGWMVLKLLFGRR